jgi:hypothetical protein
MVRLLTDAVRQFARRTSTRAAGSVTMPADATGGPVGFAVTNRYHRKPPVVGILRRL